MTYRQRFHNEDTKSAGHKIKKPDKLGLTKIKNFYSFVHHD